MAAGAAPGAAGWGCVVTLEDAQDALIEAVRTRCADELARVTEAMRGERRHTCEVRGESMDSGERRKVIVIVWRLPARSGE